jgi:putative SOS response-associated peptidase YedK
MCGRFVSSAPPDEIARYFGADLYLEEALPPSWNVAPTDDVYVVYETEETRRVDGFHWGLVPFWAKSPKAGAKMINARAETIDSNGAFKQAFAARRCLVPADGFYEWKPVEGQKRKQPYFIHAPDGEPYAFAGLWAKWRDREREETLRSTTIITTAANDVVGPIHDRMPVILPASAWAEWLDPANDDVDALARLLVPAPPSRTVAHPVGNGVSNVRENGAHLNEAVAAQGEWVAGDEPGEVVGQGRLV